MPAETIVIVEPETVQTGVVAEVKVTGVSDELAVALAVKVETEKTWDAI